MPEEATEEVKQETQGPRLSDKEMNFAALRAQKEERDREIAHLKSRLADMERSIKQAPAEEEDDIDPNDIPTKGDLKKYWQRKEKQLEAKFEAKMKQRELESTPDRLKSRFADFDRVVNSENIAYLQQSKPSVAKSLAALADNPYEQGVAAYEYIKALIPQAPDSVLEDKRRAEANAMKPKSGESVGELGALHRIHDKVTPVSKDTLSREERIKNHQRLLKLAGRM